MNGEQFTIEDIDTLMNSWPEESRGSLSDKRVIELLDNLGSARGYGTIAQFAQWLYEIRVRGKQESAATLKRERFRLLGWPLPSKFEEVAAK